MTASAGLVSSHRQPSPVSALPRRVITYLPPVIILPTYTRDGDRTDQQAQRGCGTAWQSDDRGLGWKVDASSVERQTKTTREILDEIDADTLRAAQVHGGTMSQIEVNRDRVAKLLGLYEEWKRPDEVYADQAWEICIVWRSGYGRVEIGTEEDGSIQYYVSRTLGEKSEEGSFRDGNKEELDRVMSWLNETHREI